MVNAPRIPSRQCSMKNDSGPRQCFRQTCLTGRPVHGGSERCRRNAVASKLVSESVSRPAARAIASRPNAIEPEGRPGSEIADTNSSRARRSARPPTVARRRDDQPVHRDRRPHRREHHRRHHQHPRRRRTRTSRPRNASPCPSHPSGRRSQPKRQPPARPARQQRQHADVELEMRSGQACSFSVTPRHRTRGRARRH